MGLFTAALAVILAACASSSTTATPTTVPAPATPAPQVAAKADPPKAAGPTQAAPAGQAQNATPDPRPTLVQPKELPSKGKADAPVTIVEFSDFQ